MSARPARRLALVATLIAALVLADGGGTNHGARAGTITVVERGVAPAFPRSIGFALTAEGTTAEIVEARLLYRPVAASVTQLIVPQLTPGRRVTIAATVDMMPRWLPPGLDIDYYWSLADAAGNRFDTAPRRFRYEDARHRWRTKAGGQVTVSYYAGNDAFGQDVLDTVLRSIDRLGERFGVRGAGPIRIVVYGNGRDFAASLPPNSAEWIGGQAHPELGLIVTGIQPGGGAAAEIRRVIPHEISHLLLHQATNNPYGGPAHWLDEGLAVHNQEPPDPGLEAILPRAVGDGTSLSQHRVLQRRCRVGTRRRTTSSSRCRESGFHT